MPDEFKTAVATYVAMLCEAYARKPTKATFMAYEIGLSGLNPERVKSACVAALQQNRQYMPTPGELRELGLANGQPFDTVATRAWECLCTGIARVGYTLSPNFEDGLINATVRQLGGWERVCGLPAEEFDKWFRKDFEKLYLQMLRNGCAAELCRPLVGAVERESAAHHGQINLRSGKPYELPPVVEVAAGYRPRVKSLPAPKREPVRAAIEFKKNCEEVPEARAPKMKHKRDLPKHLKWHDKADLEYELTPEQIEEQEKNRKLLSSLSTAKAPA